MFGLVNCPRKFRNVLRGEQCELSFSPQTDFLRDQTKNL